MDSSHTPHPKTSHQIPGPKLAYGYISHDASTYTPYPPTKSLKAHGRQESSPHSYSQHDRVSSTADSIKHLQDEIRQLQLVDHSRSEVIVEQKIEIAVLKNELERARRDKEGWVSSLGILAESINRGACATSSTQILAGASNFEFSNSDHRIKALEKEIERYRKSERELRSRIQDLERGPEDRARANELGGTQRANDVLRKEIIWMDDNAGSQIQARGEGKGKMIERELASGLGSANPPQSQQEAHRNVGPGPSTSQLARTWGGDLNNDLRINSYSSDTQYVAGPVHADLGMCSLEDFLDNDGLQAPVSAQASSIPSTMILEFPPSITAQSSSLSAVASKLLEDERPFDEQVEENKEAMHMFANMPTPGVIKSGFSLEGSFRGADYDKMKQSVPSRDFDRFGRNFRSDREAHTGPGTLFDSPKDRSFDQGLWHDFQDRNGAVETHMRAATGRNDTRFPDFFRYGIQYIPAEDDSNFLRTVHLSNLPLGTEVRDVLARVRGGDILSATVVNMGKIAPGTVQARVVFKHEAAAEDYVLYAAEHPISFGENHVAKVTLIETPTYPLPAKQVSRLREQTRCIAVLDIPGYFSLAQLVHDLACGNGHRAKSLIESWIDEDFTLHLQFANVDVAGSAWAILHAWNAYRGLDCRWETDPCAGEVEELANGVEPRPRVYPKNWDMRQEQVKERGGRQSDETGVEVGGEGRKCFAALENQKVSIPDFRTTKLKSASWADEVNDDLEEAEDPKSDTLDLLMNGRRNEASTSETGEGSKSASGSSTPVDEASGTPDSKSQDTSPDTKHEIIESEQNSSIVPLSSLQPSHSTQMDSPSITILTVDQELQAALLASNSTKDLANSIHTTGRDISTTARPILETRRAVIGLAGSKYASDIPGFVDTGKRPRSIHINAFSRASAKTSPTRHTFEATSTSEPDKILPPGSNVQTGGPKQRFSASPPRVNLQSLIKSERSSFASAGRSEPAGESEAEIEIQTVDEDVTTENVVTKPKVQLFKWFQLPGGKKRTLGVREEEADEKEVESPTEELKTGSTNVEISGTKVVNPDEIDLSEDEDEIVIADEKKDVVAGSDAPSSSSISTDNTEQNTVQEEPKIATTTEEELLEDAIERADSIFG